MWFRLYLPMFWFNVGLFTLMKIDSLMVLAYPHSSFPMMLKLSSVMVWPVCCICPWMGEGCFRCSFLLSPRVLEVSPIYSSLQSRWLHWFLYMIPLCCPWGPSPWASLNQNNLNHIWDRVLFNTPGLKLGYSQQGSS